MTSQREHLLFAPGPIRVPEIIKKTFRDDPPYFASREFSNLLGRIQPLFQKAINSPNPVMIGCGSGSLGLQVSVKNILKEGDKVVVVSHGKYGQLWGRMCEAHGCDVWYANSLFDNEPVPVSRLEDLISAAKMADPCPIKAVLITHVETTTAVKSPMDEYTDLIRREVPGALIAVDAVSSFLTEELDASQYDVVVMASQKALSLPPGMFFIAASDRAFGCRYAARNGEIYFDFQNEVDRARKNVTTFTPAAYLFPGLYRSLFYAVETIGVDKLIAFSKEAGSWLRDKVSTVLPIFSYTNGVTAYYTRDNGLMLKELEARGIYVGDGIGSRKGQLIRVMHFGWALDRTSINRIASSIRDIRYR